VDSSLGYFLFFALFILVLAGCWLIEYPDVVPAAFTLTAMDAPRTVVLRSEGKLIKILVKDGQSVDKGQVLAFCESASDPEQVLKLLDDIERFSNAITIDRWISVNNFNINEYNRLGEIQQEFQTFSQKLNELRTFLAGGFYAKKRKLLIGDAKDLKDLEKNLIEQLDLQKRDFELALEEHNIQEVLYKKRIISPLEYKKEKAKLLAREIPVKNLSAYIIQNRTSQASKQKEILELDNTISGQKNGFRQALRTLQSSIESWKQKYVPTAPVSGRVSFIAPWQEQQYIAIGQELLTVEPVRSNYRGLLKISQLNMGKLAAGQTVLIKLDGYSYREYGMIEGELGKLSMTPGTDSVYWAYVSLPNQLTTNYHRTLPYRNGLKGSAEIVTSNRRIIERFVSVLSSLGR
jgi:multidrug resistance efflux pump